MIKKTVIINRAVPGYTTPRKPNNFTENLIPKRVKLDDKYRGQKDE
jgi:hypothetical protein